MQTSFGLSIDCIIPVQWIIHSSWFHLACPIHSYCLAWNAASRFKEVFTKQQNILLHPYLCKNNSQSVAILTCHWFSLPMSKDRFPCQTNVIACCKWSVVDWLRLLYLPNDYVMPEWYWPCHNVHVVLFAVIYRHFAYFQVAASLAYIGTFRSLRFTAEGPLTDRNIPVWVHDFIGHPP